MSKKSRERRQKQLEVAYLKDPVKKQDYEYCQEQDRVIMEAIKATPGLYRILYMMTNHRNGLDEVRRLLYKALAAAMISDYCTIAKVDNADISYKSMYTPEEVDNIVRRIYTENYDYSVPVLDYHPNMSLFEWHVFNSYNEGIVKDEFAYIFKNARPPETKDVSAEDSAGDIVRHLIGMWTKSIFSNQLYSSLKEGASV